MSDLRDLYQEVIIDHSKSPRNFHKLKIVSHTAAGHNPLCGDRLFLYLHIENGIIKDMSFEGAGCAISTASASLMTEQLKGKTAVEAKALFNDFHQLLTEDANLNEEEIRLGKLAVFSGVREYPSRVKCATLAWHTFCAALQENNGTISTE